MVDGLDGKAWRRLGYIIDQNAHVIIEKCSLDAAGLCAGLRTNQCIKEFVLVIIDPGDTAKFSSMVPFLSDRLEKRLDSYRQFTRKAR